MPPVGTISGLADYGLADLLIDYLLGGIKTPNPQIRQSVIR